MNIMQKYIVLQTITSLFVIVAITIACLIYDAEADFLIVCIVSPGLIGMAIAIILLAIFGWVVARWRRMISGNYYE